jgi:hypothetical protein
VRFGAAVRRYVLAVEVAEHARVAWEAADRPIREVFANGMSGVSPYLKAWEQAEGQAARFADVSGVDPSSQKRINGVRVAGRPMGSASAADRKALPGILHAEPGRLRLASSDAVVNRSRGHVVANWGRPPMLTGGVVRVSAWPRDIGVSGGHAPRCYLNPPRGGSSERGSLLSLAIRDRVGSTPSLEDRVMSIVVRFNPTSMTAAKYDETIAKIEAAGTFPPDGLDYHVCFGSEGNLRVSEIWDSREQLAAFGERLMPILAAAGIEFSGEPEIFEAHNVIKR